MPVHDWSKLEAGLFHHFHFKWISELDSALNQAILPADFYSLVEQRTGVFEPDLLTLRRALEGPDAATVSHGLQPAADIARHAVGIAEAPPQVELIESLEAAAYLRKRRTIVIRHISDDHIVALIEIVSPGNKSGREAIRQFVTKVVAALSQDQHVLVLDLFPPTPRDPHGLHELIWNALSGEDLSRTVRKRLSFVSYAAGPKTTAYLQSFENGELLPKMPLFLTQEDYVTPPLEETYMRAFSLLPRHIQAELSN